MEIEAKGLDIGLGEGAPQAIFDRQITPTVGLELGR